MIRRVTETVQHEVFNGEGRGRHGNVIETWAAPVEVGIYAYNPGVTEDARDVTDTGSDRDIARPSIYTPSSVIMGARDRVTVRGRLFEVDGDTRVFHNPYGSRMDGNQINLVRVEG